MGNIRHVQALPLHRRIRGTVDLVCRQVDRDSLPPDPGCRVRECHLPDECRPPARVCHLVLGSPWDEVV